MAMKMLIKGSCLALTLIVLMNVQPSSGSMNMMMKSAMAMMGAEKCEPIMDYVTAKAEKVKSTIFRYCEQRCKATNEFNGEDVTSDEMELFILEEMDFVLGRMEYDCWGLNDMEGANCADPERASLFKKKYKSREGAVKACQAKINVDKVKKLFKQVWKKCIKGDKGKKFRALKGLCSIDSKKEPAKSAFKDLGDCITGECMPQMMGMTDCGQWAGVLCIEGKSKIEKITTDYLEKWFKDGCIDFGKRKVNALCAIETFSAKYCPKGAAKDKKKVDCTCKKSSKSFPYK